MRRVLSREDAGSSDTAVIAIGGYGRRELAPFSDVDLMFLVKSRKSQKEAQKIQVMLCLLWDMGLQVGHSVRTLKEALQMGNGDLVSLNSMLDARLIVGNLNLYAQFDEEKLSQLLKRGRKAVEAKCSVALRSDT
jgi:[protein-PII] uridylyltransferase